MTINTNPNSQTNQPEQPKMQEESETRTIIAINGISVVDINRYMVSIGDSESTHVVEHGELVKHKNGPHVDQGELVKHNHVIETLTQLGLIGVLDSFGFKKNKFKDDKLIRDLINSFLSLHRALLSFYTVRDKNLNSQKSNKISIKQNYNKCLNKLIGFFSTESPICDILFLDGNLNFIKQRNSPIKIYTDFNDPEKKPITEEPYTLRLAGGGKTSFESVDEIFNCLKSNVENCTFENIFMIPASKNKDKDKYSAYIHFHDVNYALKIHFPGSSFDILSDSPKIKHILCDNNPPKFFNFNSELSRHVYKFWLEYILIVQNKIKQIISSVSDTNKLDIDCINCCNAFCTGKTLCIKPQHNGTNKNKIKCYVCSIELCSHGCGKIYHEEFPCELTIDELSDAVVTKITKICPNIDCNTKINKDGGCNHMTCKICTTQFCWICNKEIEKDNYGHYAVTEHYNSGDCNQFSE